MQNDRNDMGIVVLATALALIGVLLAGCMTSNAPNVAWGTTEMNGYKGMFSPDSDGNFIGGSAASGIVDNPSAFGAALAEAGATPEEVEAAASSDTALTALIDKVVAADPAAAETLNKLLAVRSGGAGYLNITTADLTYTREMDAAVSALISSARAAQTAASKDSKVSNTKPDTSGTGLNIPISVTPTQ